MVSCGRPAGGILLAAVGLMLALYGAVFSSLFLIGEKTMGEITAVRRELGESANLRARGIALKPGAAFCAKCGGKTEI